LKGKLEKPKESPSPVIRDRIRGNMSNRLKLSKK
jgi:hypothetical protein